MTKFLVSQKNLKFPRLKIRSMNLWRSVYDAIRSGSKNLVYLALFPLPVPPLEETPGRVKLLDEFIWRVVATLHDVARADISSRGGVQKAGGGVSKPGFLTRTESRRTPDATGSYFDSLRAGKFKFL